MRFITLDQYGFDSIKVIQQLRCRVPHGLQENRYRHFSPSVDPHIKQILGVEFQVQPGSPDGDDARGIDQLSAGKRFPFVMVKKDPGGPVQLADNDPFRAVDGKGPVFRHQGDLAEIDFLFLDVPDLLLIGTRIAVEYNQTDDNLQGRRIGHPLLHAFLEVVANVPDIVADEFQGTFPAVV